MFTYLLILWLKSGIFFATLCWAGFNQVKVLGISRRLELLIPLGFIQGIASYIFLLNSMTFFFKGSLGIVVSFAIIILSGILIWRKNKKDQLDNLNQKQKILSLVGLSAWAVFLFYIVGRVNFGGDVQLYYDIAGTFNQGNFPLVAPWQPDLPLAYHYGGPIFLGAVHFFTQAHYDFSHRLVAFLSLLSLSQILIWIWKRHNSLKSFLTYQLIPISFLLTVGMVMVVWPILPLHFPKILSTKALLVWVKDLPSIQTAIETYGAPISLEMLAYFLHFALGLPIALLTLWLIINAPKSSRIWYWLLLIINLAALALVNETLFLPVSLVCGLFLVKSLIEQKGIQGNTLKLVLFVVFTILIILNQGGTITQSIKAIKGQEKSVVFFPFIDPWEFPNDPNKFNTIWSYHLGQQSSKLFPQQENWLPLRWYYLGSLGMYVIVLALIIFLWEKNQKMNKLTLSLIIMAIGSTICYNVIVPRFLDANGNRFLITANIFLQLVLIVTIINLIERSWRKHRVWLSLVNLVLLVWLILPALLPSAISLYQIRISTNRLLNPYVFSQFPSEKWLEKNIPTQERVLDLSGGLYYTENFSLDNPRYLQSLSEYAGVLVPKFGHRYKAYTFEGGPDYIDALYTLNPSSLKDLKVSVIVVDTIAYKALPDIRQKQLNDNRFFEELGITNPGNLVDTKNSERIFRIRSDYLQQLDLPGTFKDLDRLIPAQASVYIDSWSSDRVWSNLRKGLIFTLSDRYPTYIWGPGVYLNVERFINQKTPQLNDRYDYLVLNNNTDPKSICGCSTKLIWKGFRDRMVVWQPQ